VCLKADISTAMSGVTTSIDVAIAEAKASTQVDRAASINGAPCVAAEKYNVAKYKEVVILSPTAQFIAFIVEADDRLSKEAQKLLIACDVCVVQVGALYQKRSKFAVCGENVSGLSGEAIMLCMEPFCVRI
jgi:hypothetical protein